MPKTTLTAILISLIVFGSATSLRANDGEIDVSLKLESLSAVESGISYLLSRQKKDGSFSNHPGITAMSAIALKRYLLTFGVEDAKIATAVDSARKYLLSAIDDGSIVTKDHKTDVYSMSVSLMALSFIGNPEDAKTIKTLRGKLIVHQIKKAGGFSYGQGTKQSSSGYPDLSNSQWALEAVSATYEESERNRVMAMGRKLKDFIGSCQIEGSKDPKSEGGFLYFPVKSKPDKTNYKEDTDKVWGSLTLGAIKSLRFSRTEADAKDVDRRIDLGLKWVAANYDLGQNPGLKQGGWYYYLYMFSSAMVILDKDHVTMPDGTKRFWRTELLEKLMARQKGGDHWVNDNRLWMESDPNLCTAYALNAAFTALAERKKPAKK